MVVQLLWYSYYGGTVTMVHYGGTVTMVHYGGTVTMVQLLWYTMVVQLMTLQHFVTYSHPT